MKSAGFYRIIFETSCMLNNDEVFVHCSEYTDVEAFISKMKERIFSRSLLAEMSPRVRAVRLVSIQELDDGLDLTRTYTSSDLWNNPKLFPESTKALDALAKLLQEVSFYTDDLEQDVGKAVIELVAANFYDCMSSGCSPYYLAACRYLLEKHKVDLTEEVYPNCNGDAEVETWHTVADFLKEIEDIPRFEQGLLKDMPSLLLGA
jgi:hypothetical protein